MTAGPVSHGQGHPHLLARPRRPCSVGHLPSAARRAEHSVRGDEARGKAPSFPEKSNQPTPTSPRLGCPARGGAAGRRRTDRHATPINNGHQQQIVNHSPGLFLRAMKRSRGEISSAGPNDRYRRNIESNAFLASRTVCLPVMSTSVSQSRRTSLLPAGLLPEGPPVGPCIRRTPGPTARIDGSQQQQQPSASSTTA